MRKKQDRMYRIWSNMKQRCSNSNHTSYKNYGARGITVCEEWKTYKNFQNWALENGYNEVLQIDRKDNSKGYYPDNCNWVTQKENLNNTRFNHFITFENTTLTMSQWAEKLSINVHVLARRFERQWSVERALTTNVNKYFKKEDG